MSDDGNVHDWAVMLVPFSFIDGTDEATGKPRTTAELHLRRAVEMRGANAAERGTFYRSLLKMSLAPARAPPRRHGRAGPVAAQAETRQSRKP